MIYVLIANNKIKLMSSSPAKINDKICELKKKYPNTKFTTKSYSTMDFNNTFEGSRIVLSDYIEKSLIFGFEEL
jgi:hypothetical protein